MVILILNENCDGFNNNILAFQKDKLPTKHDGTETLQWAVDYDVLTLCSRDEDYHTLVLYQPPMGFDKLLLF